jgi:proline iminopeptidase
MENARNRSAPEQLPFVIKGFTEPVTSDGEMRTLYEKILSLYFKSYNSKSCSRVIEAIQYNHHAFNYCASTWFPAFSSLTWISSIDVPTLIIGGEEDWIMPLSQSADRLHFGIPKSEMVVFEESGHFPFVEEPARFNSVVSDWISRLVT